MSFHLNQNSNNSSYESAIAKERELLSKKRAELQKQIDLIDAKIETINTIAGSVTIKRGEDAPIAIKG